MKKINKKWLLIILMLGFMLEQTYEKAYAESLISGDSSSLPEDSLDDYTDYKNTLFPEDLPENENFESSISDYSETVPTFEDDLSDLQYDDSEAEDDSIFIEEEEFFYDESFEEETDLEEEFDDDLAELETESITESMAPYHASNPETIENYRCGSGVEATLILDGNDYVLNIHGNGAMVNYDLSGYQMPWISYQNDITRVIVEPGVTSIGSFAFYQCQNLKSVSLPEGIKIIHKYAFAYSSNLSEINFPDSITHIMEYAFSESGVTRFVIDTKDPLTIGKYAFSSCKDLYYVEIKSPFQGETGIFYHCSSLSSAEIYSGSISMLMFSGCTRLTNLILHEGVSRLGQSFISGCKSLKKLTLPSTITSIPWGADYSNLEELTILGHITNIERIPDDEHPFFGAQLKRILVSCAVGKEVLMEHFSSIEDYHIGEPIGYISVPPTCTVQGTYSHYCSICHKDMNNDSIIPTVGHSFSDYHVEYSKGAYGAWCDYGCGLFEEVYPLDKEHDGDTPDGFHWTYFSDGHLYIDGSGRMNDYDPTADNPAPWAGLPFTSVQMSDEITYVGMSAFDSAESLTNVELGNGITQIGSYAFYGCTALKEITLPETTSMIGTCAFQNCTSLEKVYAPKGSIEINNAAFKNCPNLAIYGYEGTPIHSYASDNQITFESFGIIGSLNQVDWIYEKATGELTITKKEEISYASIPDYAGPSGNNYRGVDTWTTNAPWQDLPFTKLVVGDGIFRIGNNAFANCTSLKETGFSEDLFDVGTGSFANCTALQELNIFAFLTECFYIGDYAFHNCDDMTAVQFPEQEELSVMIGAYAFERCDRLTNISLPLLSTVGEGCLMECNSLESVTLPGYSISARMLEGCTSLTTVLFPDDGFYARELPEEIFKGCTSLTTVDLPSSLDTICRSAFEDSGLTEITLPDSLQQVRSRAFAGTSLTTVRIPAGLETIDPGVFAGCRSLAAFDVDSENQHLSSVVGVLVQDRTKIICCPCAKTGSFTVPRSITVIGEEAFEGCEGITAVNFSEGLTTIEAGAFRGCSGIASIDIGENLISIGDNAFADCSSLTSLHLNPSMTFIGEKAFANCIGLEEVEIAATITGTNSTAFLGCTNLTIVGYDNTDADSTANGSHVSYRSLGGKGTIGTDISWLYTIADHSLLIEGTGAIPDYGTAIYGSYGSHGGFVSTAPWARYAYETCTISDGITGIGRKAFAGCPDLKEVNYSSSVTAIGDAAFANCPLLQQIEISDNVTTIGTHLFADCTGLETVTLPGNMTSIPEGTFENCRSLTQIDLPDTLTSIQKEAFAGSGITEISLPDNLQTISTNAFKGTGLTEITIPKGCTNLTGTSFGGCDMLERIGVDPENSSFSSVDNILVQGNNKLIYCPAARTGNVTVPSNITVIGHSAFDGCEGVTAINLSEGLTTIEANAFRGTGVTALHFPSTLNSMDVTALTGCELLQEIEVASGNPYYKEVDDVLYYGNRKLVYCIRNKAGTISLPGNTNEIGSNAFMDCTSIEAVEVPEGTTNLTIGTNAFAGTDSPYLSLPYSVTSITATGGIASNVIIRGYSNSAAYYFAEDNNLAFDSLGVYPVSTSNTSVHYFMAYQKLRKYLQSQGGTASYTSMLTVNLFTDKITFIYKSSFDQLAFYVTQNGIASPLSYIYEWTSGSTILKRYTATASFRPANTNPEKSLYNFSVSSSYCASGINPTSATELANYASQDLSLLLSFSESVVKQAGIRLKDLGCIYYENSSGTVHSMSNIPAKAPTCTVSGNTSGYLCSICGAGTNIPSVIPATGHTIVTDNAVSPSCSHVGLTEGSHCSTCGKTLIAQVEIPKTAHTPVTDPARAATCAAVGLTEGSHCSACGEVFTAQQEIPKLAHTPVTDPARDPSCSLVGLTEGSHCSACGEVFTAQQEIPKLAHTPVTDEAVEATCTTDGLTEGSHCSVCGETIVKQEIIPGGHKWDDGIETNAPTCGEPGTKVYNCTVCGDTKQEMIEPTGKHVSDGGRVTRQPTTAAAGVRTFTCTVCGHVIKTESIPKIDPAGDPKDPASVAAVEKTILALGGDEAPANSTFSAIQLKVKKTTKNAVTLSWKAVPGAKGYIIYGAPCGQKNKRITTVSGTSYTQSGLSKGTYYKYMVVAYTLSGGTQKAIGTSKTVHAATAGGKVGNVKKVTVKKKKVTLKMKKTFKIKAKAVPASKKLKVKKHRKLIYESSNTAVATVSSSGKIKAVGKGTCIIYVYAQNGVFAKVTVKVK